MTLATTLHPYQTPWPLCHCLGTGLLGLAGTTLIPLPSASPLRSRAQTFPHTSPALYDGRVTSGSPHDPTCSGTPSLTHGPPSSACSPCPLPGLGCPLTVHGGESGLPKQPECFFLGQCWVPPPLSHWPANIHIGADMTWGEHINSSHQKPDPARTASFLSLPGGRFF